MLTHLADGIVRRYLDEPAAVSDAERGHLAGCPRCQAELAGAAEDRDLVARAFADDAAVPGPDAVSDLGAVPDLGAVTDLDAAWARLQQRLAGPARPADPGREPDPMAAVPVPGRRRPRLVEQAVRRTLAAAVVAGVVLLGGGAAAAATDWLPVFKVQKVTPVQVSPQDLVGVEQWMGQAATLHELSAFGEVVGPTTMQPAPVPDAAAATARTGLSVPDVTKPPTGVKGAPEYLVMDRQTVTWPARWRQESLAEVGLAERGGDRVGGFSKGMQQRLGLAVALIGDPELVILDEPTSALDPLGRADVRDLVLRLRERGTTVVLNSHLIGEVERVCDRVVILDRGRVASAGTLAELLGRRQVRLLLDGVGPAAMARLERAGPVIRSGDHFTVDLGIGDAAPDVVPDLIKGLVASGARVHAVEPVRISLEDRLLELLRGEDTPS